MTSQAIIFPLVTGIGERELSRLVARGSQQVTSISFTAFYIRVPGHHILVDTGITAADGMLPEHQPAKSSPEHELTLQLARHHIDVASIDIVINTHLHWDHCGNNGLFPHATIYAQRAEYLYAVAPLPLHRGGYGEMQVTHSECTRLAPFQRQKVTLIEGDFQVTPEVTIIATPGHTPGSQSVLVHSGKRYLLVGDNMPLYENLPRAGSSEFLPSPIFVNLEDYYRSLARSAQLADEIIPGHDPRVLDRECYQ